MSAADQVQDLLKESGAVLLRDHKHEVWLLPGGNKFTRAKTPSDRRAAHNDLSDLKRALGTGNAGRGEGERREKRRKRARVESDPLTLRRTPGLTGGLAEQLMRSGFVEMAESARARAWSARWKVTARYYRLLTLQLAAGAVRLERELKGERSKACPCWWCGLKARFGRRSRPLTPKAYEPEGVKREAL